MFVRATFLLLAFTPASFATETDGKAIYAKQCASCHGANGEGTKKFPRALEGDRSVKQLAKYVAETMPEDNPGSLSAPDAEAVSAFMHDAFYSPVARERARPARVELSRLTVRQYRNAIADLVGGGMRPPPVLDDQRGLKAEYFKGRNLNRNSRALERTDATLSFDWDKKTPDAEKIPEAQEFAAQWFGSVIADESGTYDIAIHSNHSVKMWFNDPDKPILDGWVRSGNTTEYTATVPLLAGRAYPIRVQFSKAKQGVDDTKDKPNRPVLPAFVHLKWKPPHGVLENIPTRNLSPNDGGPTFVLTTPFPPDDRSLGWERGTAVSKEWDAATTEAALEVLAFHLDRLNALAKTADAAADRAAKLKAYCHQFAERAARRPLTADEKTRLVDRHFDGTKDSEVAFKKSLLLVLKSPLFLYREATETGPFAVASRLAFALWDAPPDAALLKAAASDQLKTREQVLAQAKRMAADPRALAKMRQFFHHWLNVEHAHDLAKDAKKFPGFDAAAIADLRTSLDLFVADAVLGSASDFRRLFTENEYPLSDRLAKFYSVELPASDGFRKAKLNADRRGGVLTHPFLLAANAYTAESSPIHRGVFLTRGVMGMALKPPPDAVAPIPPDLHPNLTTRERVAMQTKPATCQTCHTVINNLGFTLENFDAVGRFREKDNGKPVDANGGFLDREGKQVKLSGAAELAKYVAGSADVHRAFAEAVFHHTAQQPVRAYGPTALTELTDRFTKGNFDVKRLFAEAATVAAVGPPR